MGTRADQRLRNCQRLAQAYRKILKSRLTGRPDGTDTLHHAAYVLPALYRAGLVTKAKTRANANTLDFHRATGAIRDRNHQARFSARYLAGKARIADNLRAYALPVVRLHFATRSRKNIPAPLPPREPN
ncbi:hypothetical protein G6F24_017493 [Rhizopus arrhizus]|nr:hypothetical protein G6F24_017493 [Rhizopus arrhizus]